MKVKVILEFDEKYLGSKWMNKDNLELLLYSKNWFTHKHLLKISSYEEIKPQEVES